MIWSNLGQGSYPFSPFAMPSPNGIVETSVSTLSYSVLICFLKDMFLCTCFQRTES